MTIATNSFIQLRSHPETGEPQLFGKIGYQTMHPKVDKYVMRNLRKLEAALDAGLLKDIHGNPNTTEAVINVKVHVRKVGTSTIEDVTSFENVDGTSIDATGVDVADPEDDDESPFG
jgi:hypothetical protein